MVRRQKNPLTNQSVYKPIPTKSNPVMAAKTPSAVADDKNRTNW